MEPIYEIAKEKNLFLAHHGLNDGRSYFGFHARLGHGVGESHNPGFFKIKFEAIARCNAAALRRIGLSHGIDPANLMVFIATICPCFEAYSKRNRINKRQVRNYFI